MRLGLGAGINDNAGVKTKDATSLDDGCCNEDAARNSSGDRVEQRQ